MNTQDAALSKLFIGIDMHKRSWGIQFATDLSWGKRLIIPCDPEVLRKFAEENFPDHHVFTAYEAGCCGYSAHRSFLT